MTDSPSVATEVVRQVPLGAAAAYLNLISTYGAAIITTLAIVYAVCQFYWRSKEHRKIMGDKNVESR